jgi:hypothetical protein
MLLRLSIGVPAGNRRRQLRALSCDTGDDKSAPDTLCALAHSDQSIVPRFAGFSDVRAYSASIIVYLQSKLCRFVIQIYLNCLGPGVLKRIHDSLTPDLCEVVGNQRV